MVERVLAPGRRKGKKIKLTRIKHGFSLQKLLLREKGLDYYLSNSLNVRIFTFVFICVGLVYAFNNNKDHIDYPHSKNHIAYVG